MPIKAYFKLKKRAQTVLQCGRRFSNNPETLEQLKICHFRHILASIGKKKANPSHETSLTVIFSVSLRKYEL